MRVAIYARYSSDNQREESITAQIEAITKYCQQNRFSIEKIYTDEARSAKTDNRPQFIQMIDDSKLKIFDAIVVHKLDRFSRNRYDSAIYRRKLQNNKVRLISVLENLDDSPESKILESVLEGMAEYYSVNLAREVMKGMRQTALQGKHTGGKPPLGFDLAPDKTLVINEYEAGAIRLVFERYIDGYGYLAIANELNELGYTTRFGKQFKKISIHDILLNPKYCGTYVFNRRANGKDLSKIKSDEEIIKIEDAIPAIIPIELFEKANERLNSQKTGKKVKKMDYILTGKTFCGECKGKYYGIGFKQGRDRKSENPTKYYLYGCKNKKYKCDNKSIRKEILENLVIQEILNRVLRKEDIPFLAEALVDKIKENQNTHTHLIDKANQEIQKLKSQIDKDFHLYYENIIDSKLLAEKSNEKNERIKQLQHEIIIMESKKYAPNIDKILKYLNEQIENLMSGNPKLQQKAINAFVKQITIYKTHIDIELIIDDGNVDSDKVSGGGARLTISLSVNLPY